tara:strand:+ start:1043 stop:1162 length:120 start_codon:yes stop_codon:yes gene_type:complete
MYHVNFLYLKKNAQVEVITSLDDDATFFDDEEFEGFDGV